jgi:hypothetical protein
MGRDSMSPTWDIFGDQDTTSITISGTYSGNIISYGGTSRANGSLTADIVFNVTSNTPYSFSASTTGSVANLAQEEVRNDVSFNGLGVSDGWQLYAVSGYNSYLDSGTLAPGQYNLHVSIASARVPFGSIDDVENPIITLILPEPAGFYILLSLPLLIFPRCKKHS